MSPYLSLYPTSNEDPALMAVLAITPDETVLYDFSNTQDYYILAASTLYRVGSQYALQWFGVNGSAKTVNYPFNANQPPIRMPPIIMGIDPDSGRTGTAVTIVGENFQPVTDVSFDSIAANFTIQSNTAITTQVP